MFSGDAMSWNGLATVVPPFAYLYKTREKMRKGKIMYCNGVVEPAWNFLISYRSINFFM